MPNRKWEEAGVIGVDSGHCWIGDPCYFLGRGRELAEGALSYNDLLSLLREGNWPETLQLRYAQEGCDGLGVVVQTGYGDGVYPVLVRRDGNGRIAAVMVVFTDDEEVHDVIS